MRRSKYGYLLLALLVITGLAGTITSTSITGKERKFAVTSLKDTKNDVLKSIKDLSRAQLDFKAGSKKCSIRECVYHIAILERNYWTLLQTALKEPSNPERRSELKWTDEQLMKAMEERNDNEIVQPAFASAKMPYKAVDEAIESFRIDRANHIKYIKGTTEDLRNHVIQMPFGWIDAYQLCLVISSSTDRYMEQIELIKADPKFPAR
jgi:hypothetical protein